MRRRVPSIASLLSLWLLVQPADATDCARYDQQMRMVWGDAVTTGISTGLAVSGNRALVSAAFDHGGRFTVLDISQPSSPQTVYESVTMPVPLGDVAADGDLACITGDGGGFLQVVNIQNPAQPQFLGTCIPLTGQTVAMHGALAYVGAFEVVDLSDQQAPEIVGSVSLPSPTLGMVIQGQTVFTANGPAGMYLIDVSNPVAPSIRGHHPTPGEARDVSVLGSYAYLTGSFGMQVIDISTPTSPTLAGTEAAAAGYDIVATPGRVFIGGVSELIAVDTTIPSAPYMAGNLFVPGANVGLAIRNAYALALSGFGRLNVVDLTYPTTPVVIGQLITGGESRSVAVQGDVALLADGAFGVEVIDIADRTAPSLAALVPGPGRAWGVALAGTHGYVANINSGLEILDLTDIHAPIVVSNLALPDSTYAVAVQNGLAYLACGVAGLVVVDVSVPAAPAILGQEALPGRVRDVAVQGDYAYLAEGTAPSDGGLHIVDVSNPLDPVLRGSRSTFGDVHGVSVQGNYAYLADDFIGVSIIDVSNPAFPAFVRLMATPGRKNDVFAQGNVLYVADGPTGLVAADISSAVNAHTLGGLETLDFAWGVVADEEAVYVADRGALVIVQRHCQAVAALPDGPGAPAALGLRVLPNPAWGSVRIDFAGRSTRGPAILRVFDVLGRERQRLVTADPGLTWNGRDAAGQPLPAGVYWLQLEAGGQRTTAKLTRAR